MYMVYAVSEITPLKGQAFPLSHTTKLNTIWEQTVCALQVSGVQE